MYSKVYLYILDFIYSRLYTKFSQSSIKHVLVSRSEAQTALISEIEDITRRFEDMNFIFEWLKHFVIFSFLRQKHAGFFLSKKMKIGSQLLQKSPF